MSRMRTSGLWAMHSNARPWLVRKFQAVTMNEKILRRWIACIGIQEDYFSY
jgi:hypothetical protein